MWHFTFFKALRLSSSARRETSVGQIVNLMSVDCQKMNDAAGFLHNLWTAPIVLATAMYFLWQELGNKKLMNCNIDLYKD